MLNKKVLIFLVVFIILAVLGAGYYFFIFNKKNQNNTAEKERQTESIITNVTKVSADKISTLIPHGIFVEKNAEIIDSYTALSLKDILQSTLQYISEKSFKENIAFFETYAKKNGWIETAVSTTTQDAFYFYQKEESRLSISITYDQNKLKNLVDITLEVPKK